MMDLKKKEIILILGIVLVGLLLFSMFFISMIGIGEDCSNCVNCTDCYIGINSSEESKIFDELNGIVEIYVAEKENINDTSLVWTSIKFKSKDEAFVSAIVNNKTWNGTWKHSDNQWNPGEDFKCSS